VALIAGAGVMGALRLPPVAAGVAGADLLERRNQLNI
jgi:hypothetical protein